MLKMLEIMLENAKNAREMQENAIKGQKML